MDVCCAWHAAHQALIWFAAGCGCIARLRDVSEFIKVGRKLYYIYNNGKYCLGHHTSFLSEFGKGRGRGEVTIGC